MSSTHPMAAVRGEHRPGTAALATAVAFLRTAVAEDPDAMIALLRSLDPEHDDLGGVITFVSLIGGQGLIRVEGGPDGAHYLLDLLAAVERDAT